MQITADQFFAIVPEWVLYAEISDRSVRLYGVLRRFADKDTGESSARRRTLAAALACSVDSVDRALRELKDLGAIEVSPTFYGNGDQGPNLYLVRSSPPSAALLPPPRKPAPTPRRASAGTPAAPVRHKEPRVTNPESPNPDIAKRPTNPFWDALEELFGYRPEGGEARLWGRLAKKLADAVDALVVAPGVDTEGLYIGARRILADRVAVYVATWPEMALTPAAIDKHFQWLGSRVAASSPEDREKFSADSSRARRRAAIVGEESHHQPTLSEGSTKP